MNLEKFHEWLKLNKNSKRTIGSYYQQMSRFANLYNNKLNQENINDYLIKLKEQGKKLSSINGFKNALHSYCKFSGDQFNIPSQKVPKRRGIKHYFTEKELTNKDNNILKNIYEEHDLVLRFMFYTGVRPQEVLNLKVEHINFKKKDINIYNAKGNKDRVIPFLNNKLYNDIKNHCEGKEGYVFNIKYSKINSLLKQIKKEQQLSDSEVVEPRTMRNSFAKYCLSNGMDISYLKKLLGHTDIKITELYAEPDEKMIKDFCENMRLGKNKKDDPLEKANKEIKELKKTIKDLKNIIKKLKGK